MGVDVLLMSVEQKGTSPKRRQVRPVEMVLDPLDRFSRLCATSRRPMLGRVDPCRTLVLTRADMPQFISELEAELTEHDDRETRDLLDQVLGLARRCQARDAHELHLDGD
ncbi:hypothetical protein SAMN05216188_12429 [Lentzea xinjiangensis]|uniref:Uncharacterized protein n=1 Tax=Lentzea xinjiangensis TaxID=402600 RepID=A0A1H9V4M9_9PSEU|nr:hypothetical protein [Lentzea xinjiangensis]SES16501.1 hypothetical protein SAMN05216188_12429 [Lentzea xinjiangensis]